MVVKCSGRHSRHRDMRRYTRTYEKQYQYVCQYSRSLATPFAPVSLLQTLTTFVARYVLAYTNGMPVK